MPRLRALAALGLIAGLATPLGSQTVRPAVVEYQEQARGRFELVNESLFPLTVVLDVRGFHVEASGELIETPLDTSVVDVRLSAMSFRIPPRQTYVVSYEARAKSYPAWFIISSALTGARTASGLNVRVILPHVVYMLQKESLRANDVIVRALEFDRPTQKVRLTLENTSNSLGRALSTTVRGDAGRPQEGGAFPLFPHSIRRVEIPWPHDVAPRQLLVEFADFTLDRRRPVSAAWASALGVPEQR